MASQIREITGRIILALYRDGHPDKAMLASLRNAPTITSQRAQTVWPILMANLEQWQLSKNGKPTSAEVAVYTAIRFYAIHQQGQNTGQVYASSRGEQAEGTPFFTALAKLRGNEDLRTAMDRRVQPLLATTTAAGVINDLSHLVSILKANDRAQKIDYASLAEDLYELQESYERSSQVRLRWGQQYFWVKPTQTTKGEENHD